MQQRLQKIKDLYCRSVKLPITHAPLLRITAKTPVDWEKLEHQYSAFFAAAVEASKSMAAPLGRDLPKEVEVDADASFSFEEEDDDDTGLAPLHNTAFWRSFSSSPGQADAISEWTKLAGAGTSAWLVRGRAHVLRYVIPQEQVPQHA